MEAPVAGGVEDRDATPWEGALDEPVGDGEECDEPSRGSAGAVTCGIGTVGGVIDGVEMLGVLTCGVVVVLTVTDGTVTAGTPTDGTDTVGTDTVGTDTVGIAAVADGTPTPTAGVTATDSAPHTARTVLTQRLTD